jgi:chemotaxis protein CheX
MNVKFVNPFIKTTQDVFRQFVGITVQPGKPFIYSPASNKLNYDISGIIGLAGEVVGFVIISFPKLVALKTVSKITERQTKIFDELVIDSVGELINIIAGNSKREMEDVKIVISLPSIVKGVNHQLAWISGVPVICIPFGSDLGDFYVFVSMKDVVA